MSIVTDIELIVFISELLMKCHCLLQYIQGDKATEFKAQGPVFGF